MSSTRAVSQTRLSTSLRPLARLRSGRNDRFFDAIALRLSAETRATIHAFAAPSKRASASASVFSASPFGSVSVSF